MSEQVEFLRNCISAARGGNNDKTVVLLREICREAVDKAPASDLIKIAESIYCMARELESPGSRE